MRRRESTRVPGHALQHEGKPFVDGGEGEWSRTYYAAGVALCECGETSPELGTDAGRKRWHTAHKDGIREAGDG